MLDLIIPVYNNRAGLCDTLMSIGPSTKQKIFITIVDDASTEIYDDIIEVFQKFFPIRIITLSENCGPGIARQKGLDAATQPYVLFVDCGDTFTSPMMLERMLNTVEAHSQCNAWFWSHTEESVNGYAPVGSQHNRVHGKIYRRQFLIDNNITFCEKSPRANEDIGFNTAIRLICFEDLKRTKQGKLFISEENAINWVTSPNSIVRANKCAFYYKEQNMGLALNMEHTFNIAEQYGVSEEFLTQQAYEVMAHEYCFYLSTKSFRPEFTKEAFDGALYYYKHIFRKYKMINPKQLKIIFYHTLGNMISETWSPIHEALLPIDYQGFLDKLEEIVLKEEQAI